ACNNEPAETPANTSPGNSDSTAPAEFADAKYVAIGKQGIASLSAGNVDAWMESFADNAVYAWNYGDSVVGKAAITAYWKKRRTEVMDSISFSNDIWVPLKVNKPQGVEGPGVWLLGWYQVNAKYKTGKSMLQWIHTDMHFDANDKIDRVIQYLDRSLIMAATTQ
ncbi:MAG TPA: nuclear transport factor 2 family protein, partial [Ferruginibacter sp.]|nr:nuclear transport factor 2 family protein [Ferruginibacter sp.]